ncbi:carboxypeptidase-like regulatory domain-containing protein [Flavobacterium capsici]|uniref:Carboxypeptidase-like regulatory domain-containing protein n=1 Tax=Flavobacterium capsici TaxID=3075618 RepID=A0AA96F0N7_9FLAO|nr:MULTISPECIES: carboxypeptidase-like regulatory domain-containing protein [unclassified Flavobacterium]WNM20321.1 carboxypeptidase-like regulatory domain-containing protein [Flavobacterium sp. PMR2A8]WNM21711.1 carboxypeptidase-like regulatory domain-containing protein [Flavobacterium sp. PMTSA4]
MTSYQERKLSMFIVFAQFIQGTLAAILASMPNFETLFDKFLLKINEINVLTGNQMLNRKGNRLEKIYVRDSLCFDADDIASKVMAYANYENNFLLFNEVKYTKNVLLQMADTACKTCCQIIHDKALEYVTELATYGITSGVLTDFQAKIDLFELTIPKPKAGIQDKKFATEQLKEKFEEASEFLKKMFILSKTKKKDYPDFVKEFVIAKRIDKPAFVEMSARGAVVDDAGERIGKVTMECKKLNFKRRVAASGGFYLKHMENGVYEFVFSRPGYETTVVEMVFYKGTRFEVEVVMKQLAN